MAKIERLDIGNLGLVQETDGGRIRQIGLTEEQSKTLQILVASLSEGNPLVQMGEEYDLILKKDSNSWKKVHEQEPPTEGYVIAKSPNGVLHLTSWRESYKIFMCQNKQETSFDWSWKNI